jgi:hypothetical protein
MPDAISLPREDRTLQRYVPRSEYRWPSAAAPAWSRVALAAVHVVADPWVDVTPAGAPAVDWDQTLAFRRHIWGLGLGVAEAMDTAQRGMGMDWPSSAELIRRSAAEARAVGGRLVCGAQTDQLVPGVARGLADVVRAYEEQCALIEDAGGQVVLMASRELCRLAGGPDDYLEVYGRVLSGLRRPALIHWLGEVFDPQLAGYWGSPDLDVAADSLLGVIAAAPGKVDGVKLAVLDQAREMALRRRLPAGVRMYTGDDFDYPTTMVGDEHGHSDALLGALSMIAPAAAVALAALDEGRVDEFRRVLAPTVPLARHVFGAPTYYYKTGVCFLAWLNGHQRHFRMVGGLESGRSAVHLARLFVLADEADLLRDVDLASARMRALLAAAGIG